MCTDPQGSCYNADSDSGMSGVGLGFCILNKFPGDALLLGLRPCFEKRAFTAPCLQKDSAGLHLKLL